MTTTEHLAKIRALCVERLEIASKRAPGKWEIVSQIVNGGPFATIMNQGGELITDVCYPPKTVLGNSHFIASCAGPAEAGWRATIEMIDALEEVEGTHFWEYTASKIIAAWPEDLL